MFRFILIFVFGVFSSISYAQIGGRATYQFLNTVTSPQLAGLSGVNISHTKPGLEMVYFNPSLLDSSAHNSLLEINYTNYLADINFGFSGYGFNYKNWGTFLLGVKYINYGNFIEADAAGEILGNFSASETALFLSWANKYKYNIKYGSSFKLVNSFFYQYYSIGVLVDGGANWTAKNELTRVGLVFKNMGTQIVAFDENNFEPLPFEIQLGVTHKLEHAPFRFSLTAHNLQNPNIWFESPNNINSVGFDVGDEIIEEPSTPWGEVILRHFALGVEMVLSDNFQILGGYHHQRRSELSLSNDSRGGAVGFSFGFAFQINKFRFNYARSVYHLAGATNHFGVSAKLNQFTTTKQKVDSPDL